MTRRRFGLGPGGEFDHLRAMLSASDVEEGSDPRVLLGPGDDAAVLAADPASLVVCSDLSVEGVHFRFEWLSGQQVGYRAAVAALSDLAAMAAEPVAVLLSLATPPSLARDELVALQTGVADACEGVGASIVGGDLTRSTGPTVIDVVAIGRAVAPIRRSTAQVGDEVWVTGPLGGPRETVHRLQEEESVPAGLMASFAYPSPKVSEAIWLAGRSIPSSMIDLSDGLIGDIGHIATASQLTAVLQTDSLPIHPELLAGDASRHAVERALRGGEEYELCFTSRPGVVSAHARDFEEEFGSPLTRVGQMQEAEGDPVLVDWGRGPHPPTESSFDHFPSEGIHGSDSIPRIEEDPA